MILIYKNTKVSLDLLTTLHFFLPKNHQTPIKKEKRNKHTTDPALLPSPPEVSIGPDVPFPFAVPVGFPDKVAFGNVETTVVVEVGGEVGVMSGAWNGIPFLRKLISAIHKLNDLRGMKKRTN